MNVPKLELLKGESFEMVLREVVVMSGGESIGETEGW